MSTNGIAQQVTKQAEQLYKKGSDALSDIGSDIESQAVKSYKMARKELRHAATEVERSVKHNPLLAVAIAGGVGFLAARFFMRNRNKQDT